MMSSVRIMNNILPIIINMESLKYKIIKSEDQYSSYCQLLETLVFSEREEQDVIDEIELLTYLIEKWDDEHNTFADAEPIQLLGALMAERNPKAKDLVDILKVSKGLVSDILNYKKGLSKDIIRALSGYFKVSQEALNLPYKLSINSHLKSAVVMNTIKGLSQKQAAN